MTFAFCAMSVCANAQKETAYYLYKIVNFNGGVKNKGFKVSVDDGQTIEKLCDEKGNRMEFKTPAGALMYFTSKGWELYISGSTSDVFAINGTGGNDTSSYWILRKPCTKEELDDAVIKSIRNP